MTGLEQQTLFEDGARIARSLPLGDELGALHPGGSFALVEDPAAAAHTVFVGMTVLRPALEAWNAPVIEGGVPRSMYAVDGWTFAVRGVRGSWPISGGNVLDAFRLALQYGTSDAVIVGSGTLLAEGIDRGNSRGYLWQPYNPAGWRRVRAACSGLAAKIGRVRRLWQQQGVLSPRTYPAQIVVSQSGEPHGGDILDARIFHDRHPDGSAVEAYVLTSEEGAERIASRLRGRGQGDRADSLLVAASPAGRSGEIDLAAAARVLRGRLDIRLADHDGGATVLSKFSEAGVLPQINLTLMHGASVRDVVCASQRLPLAERKTVTAELEERARSFFRSGRLPRELQPAYVLADAAAEAIVVTFDARGLRGF